MCFTRPTSVRKDNLCVVVLQVDCLVRSAVMYRHRIQFVEKPMKKIVFGLSAIILALSLVQSARSIEPKVRESLIVSTDWLAKHLNDDSLVLLQVGEKDEYVAEHIPGAQFISLA